MPADALLQALSNEMHAVQSFIHTLEEEHQALVERAAPQTLNAITARKQELAEQLESLAAARDAALTSLGFENGYKGMEAAIRQLPAVESLWLQLQTEAEKARTLNERNGLLIRTHLRFTNQALDVLRGTQGATLYQPDGKRPAVQLGTTRRA